MKLRSLQEFTGNDQASERVTACPHTPTTFICDSPCGLARHLEVRENKLTKKLWKDNCACFERPTLDKPPSQNVNIPEIVITDYSTNKERTKMPEMLSEVEHPITKSKRHFILGDRFHSQVNPHKSDLCAYHDINLCQQDVNKGKLYYIGGKKTSLSKKLLAVKPPDIVGRMPRSLEDLKHWKALVPGTHHAMEQIGCAIGLCYGLSNFTQRMLHKQDILKENKDLLRHLSGISQHDNKKSAKIDGGFFCGKEKLSSIDGNMKTLVALFVTKNRWPPNYEIEAYRRFDSDDGQKFYSEAVKTHRTDSTVIEYTDNKNNIYYARVKLFLKIFNHGICICNALDENNEQSTLFDERDCADSLQMFDHVTNEQDKIRGILKKYTKKKLVKHHINIKKHLGRLLVISVEQIRRKCVFIDILTDVWVISRFPNVIEHN
ncbi:hypothetical protein AC249_AIPGENE13542 [Exaiptasia diaphana]|nr:hypothetical protein AC249_AIPGENE13542 [Exaiptasia diaphana]